MIDEETKRIISEFMDEIGVPCADYDKAFRFIVNVALIFSLEERKKGFIHYLSEENVT